MSMEKDSLYEGPIFDVQAHALKPSAYETVAGIVKKSLGLTEETKDTIVNDVCVKLADDLCGAARIKALDKTNIQVVTVNTFFPPLAPESLLNMVDELNIWMAKRTQSNPQLIGIASIPPPPVLAEAGTSSDGQLFTTKSISMVRRAISELGLKGILIASNYNGVFIGDASFEPYFALAEELNVPVIVHPAVNPVEGPSIPRKNIPTYTGFLNDQRTTLLDLVIAGTFEKFPRVKIIATHLGGGILTSIGRFRALSQRFPTDSWFVNLQGIRQLLPQPIEYYLKMIYYDCNNAEAIDIMHAVSVVGTEHLLTGSDFPWTDDRFTRQVLSQLEADTAKKIAYENASALFNQC